MMAAARAYYNEIDPFAAAWLRELIAAGAIAPGDVDERSIAEVTAADLVGYTQCHFFAGIGGWSYALRLAGWADARPVWTGSCPCQPFSGAGKGEGGSDDRHLWPHWARLIRECRPVTVFGEQVESAIGHGWIDLVSDDLEREGYAIGAACIPAASVGAPHIRQRLWFVAERMADAERDGRRADESERVAQGRTIDGRTGATTGFVAHADGGQSRHHDLQRGGGHLQRAQDTATGELAESESGRQQQQPHPAREGASLLHAATEPSQCLQSVGGYGTGTGDPGTCGEVRGLAHADGEGTIRHTGEETSAGFSCGSQPHSGSGLLGVADPASRGQRIHGGAPRNPGHECGTGGGVADATRQGSPSHTRPQPSVLEGADLVVSDGGTTSWSGGMGDTTSPWANIAWLPCRDGKWRPTESLVQPLADGVCADLGYVRDANTGQAWLSPLTTGTTHRAGRLKGYGNAINPYVAAEMIAAYIEVAHGAGAVQEGEVNI